MSGSAIDEELEPRRRDALESLLADLPDSYANSYALIQSIRKAFHQAIAIKLAPALNEHLLSRPQDSTEERRELAGYVNQQLRQVGLAVKCPRTGRPAVLVVDSQDRDNPEITRFRLGVHDEDGKYVHSFTRRNLPPLELTESSPRIEPLARSFRHGRGRQR